MISIKKLSTLRPERASIFQSLLEAAQCFLPSVAAFGHQRQRVRRAEAAAQNARLSHNG